MFPSTTTGSISKFANFYSFDNNDQYFSHKNGSGDFDSLRHIFVIDIVRYGHGYLEGYTKCVKAGRYDDVFSIEYEDPL